MLHLRRVLIPRGIPAWRMPASTPALGRCLDVVEDRAYGVDVMEDQKRTELTYGVLTKKL